MLASKQTKNRRAQRPQPQRVRGAADVRRRPGSSTLATRPFAPAATVAASPSVTTHAGHPFAKADENAHLHQYESRTKQAFDNIEPTLRQIAQYQHQVFFAAQAQEIIQEELGLEIPESLLNNTWVQPLDMGRVYAWCVFETFRKFADDFYHALPLAQCCDVEFQRFIEGCGFHTVDFSPCADGRLAHMIRYVLRLPYKSVRRKSYAGAMFDVEDSLQKWQETEFLRYREGQPNTSDANTRYLKVAVYHYSSSHPETEGCAAHGSDPVKAANGALTRLQEFQRGVENSFCCGASIDLLLVGIDTDNDAIRVHIPDVQKGINSELSLCAKDIYAETRYASNQEGEQGVRAIVDRHIAQQNIVVSEGMRNFVVRLLLNNISQIDYVKRYFNGGYSDIGHQERFIGMGLGFEEVQLRNLTYFAYLKTVELGAADLDVGIKIFTGLNINRGLPAPVVIRYDYHGNVPGAKERAVERCHNLDQALKARFASQAEQGLLYTLLVVRDCNVDQSIEVVANSAVPVNADAGH